jgi:uncharacterized protein YdhG (YjbR/CyaY superfamily)
MTSLERRPEHSPVTAFVDAAPEPARSRLRVLAEAVRAEVPDAVERIAYGLATWHQGENLIHLGAFARHVGIYPGAAAIVAFADELKGYRTSKGAIQVPHDGPLPVDLVRRITRWRIEQAATTSKTKTTKAATSKPKTTKAATTKAATTKAATTKAATTKAATTKAATTKAAPSVTLNGSKRNT